MAPGRPGPQRPHPSQEARWAPSSLCPPCGHRSAGPLCPQPIPHSRPTFCQHPWADTKPTASGKKVGGRTGSRTSWSRETWVTEPPPVSSRTRGPSKVSLETSCALVQGGTWGRVAGCPPGGGRVSSPGPGRLAGTCGPSRLEGAGPGRRGEAPGGLSPECPSRRVPGDSKTGW